MEYSVECGGGGQTNPSPVLLPPPPPSRLSCSPPVEMPTFEIAVGPPIAENLQTYRTPGANKRLDEDPATSLRYRSISHDRKRRKMTREWKDEELLLTWLAAEESEHSIKLIVSNITHSDSLLWQEQRIMKCSREYTGGRPDQHSGSSAPEERNRKIPSKKTGCRCRLTLKFYRHMEIILGKYESKHDYPLGDENLRFMQLTDGTMDLVMVMLTMGIDAKMIVSLIFPPPSLALMSPSPLASLTHARQQLKRICESTKRTHHDYYITMRDINRIQRIVEDDKIWLDENDAIFVKVWATWLQQAGASGILKDKIDAAPPGLGLSPDTFILCIHTAFQKDQFNLIGKDFLGIDATHNTTQYVGLQLFTLIA